MIEVNDLEETVEPKMYKRTKINRKTGQPHEVEMDFQDTVVDLLTEIAVSFNAVAGMVMRQVQPASTPGRFRIINPQGN